MVKTHRCLRLVAALLLCSCIGCGTADHYETRLDSMNRSVATARNEMILLNVLRARYSHPLSFISVTSLSASQGGGGNLGLPTLTFGPVQTDLQRQFVFGNNSVAATINGNITVAPLETREFYQGLLQPIGLPAVQFLLAQGYPRQILFLLLVESIRLRGASGEMLLYNNPTDATYPAFSRYLQRLVQSGVTVEARSTAGGTSVPSICFDRGATDAMIRGAGPYCGSVRTAAEGLTGLRDEQLGPVSVDVTLRSTSGVFRYLGRLTDPAVGPLVTLMGEQVGTVMLGEDKRLFPVVHYAHSECLARANYLGEVTCLPAVGAEQGAVALQLLSQLLGLSVSVRDLPALPTIRLAN